MISDLQKGENNASANEFGMRELAETRKNTRRAPRSLLLNVLDFIFLNRLRVSSNVFHCGAPEKKRKKKKRLAGREISSTS